jgi:hypothetical protein
MVTFSEREEIGKETVVDFLNVLRYSGDGTEEDSNKFNADSQSVDKMQGSSILQHLVHIITTTLLQNVYFFLVYFNDSSRDSSVGTATGYGLDDRGVGVRVPVG